MIAMELSDADPWLRMVFLVCTSLAAASWAFFKWKTEWQAAIDLTVSSSHHRLDGTTWRLLVDVTMVNHGKRNTHLASEESPVYLELVGQTDLAAPLPTLRQLNPETVLRSGSTRTFSYVF